MLEVWKRNFQIEFEGKKNYFSFTEEDAGSVLMNLSPYEMKSLLHHILSGKEFEGKIFFNEFSIKILSGDVPSLEIKKKVFLFFLL